MGHDVSNDYTGNNVPPFFLDELYNKHEDDMIRKIDDIEKVFVQAREKDNIPIYMTRSRLKNYKSAYLKCHKKNKTSIEDLTDLIGLRVLCLFQQDVLIVYKYLLEKLSNYADKINEVILYGETESKKYKEIYENTIDAKQRTNIEYSYRKKTSGYQSIHITGYFKDNADNNIYPFELQLRTLLQDVWGELEHHLAYKSEKQNDFIKKSFKLFSRDLKTNDMLLSSLYDSSSKNDCINPNKKFTLGNVFMYDDKLEPDILKEDPIYQEYMKNMMYILGLNEKQKHKQREKLATIKKNFNSIIDNNTGVRFWIDMEDAFFLLLFSDTKNNNVNRAEAMYHEYWESSYVANFRLGQIFLYKKNIVKALKYFTYSKTILDSEPKDKYKNINEIKLRINIMLIYWINGGYEHNMFEELTQVMSLYRAHEKDIKDDVKNMLLNSIVWYLLEYIENYTVKNYDINMSIEKLEEQFSDFFQKLLENTKSLESSKCHIYNEVYDSIAMCHLYHYNKNNNKDSIKHSFENIKKAYNILNDNNAYYDSSNLVLEHYKTIQCKYQSHQAL